MKKLSILLSVMLLTVGIIASSIGTYALQGFTKVNVVAKDLEGNILKETPTAYAVGDEYDTTDEIKTIEKELGDNYYLAVTPDNAKGTISQDLDDKSIDVVYIYANKERMAKYVVKHVDKESKKEIAKGEESVDIKDNENLYSNTNVKGYKYIKADIAKKAVLDNDHYTEVINITFYYEKVTNGNHGNNPNNRDSVVNNTHKEDKNKIKDKKPATSDSSNTIGLIGLFSITAISLVATTLKLKKYRNN